MMTSPNGNIFRVTDHLCGDVPGQRQIPHTKGQWRGALMFSLICAWISGWVNNHEAGNLRCHRAHYGVTVTVISIHKRTANYSLCCQTVCYCCNASTPPTTLHTTHKSCIGYFRLAYSKQCLFIAMICTHTWMPHWCHLIWSGQIPEGLCVPNVTESQTNQRRVNVSFL